MFFLLHFPFLLVKSPFQTGGAAHCIWYLISHNQVYIYIHNCGYSICYIRVSHLVCGISPLSRCFWLSALSRTAARRCRRVSESFSGSSRQTDIAMEAMAHLLLIYLAKMVIYCRGLSTMWQSGKPNHP
jgi:hypothetical protein